MSELTIKLNGTNSAQFRAWLNDYIRKTGGVNSTDYPYTGGAVYRILYYDVFQVSEVSYPARIKQRPFDGEPPSEVTAWSVNDPDENVTYSWWEWDMNNALSLSWLELGERLKVTIKHYDAKWIIPPVFQFLWAIKADYPETGETITPYIVEKADCWNYRLTALTNDTAVADIIEQAREEIGKQNATSPSNAVKPKGKRDETLAKEKKIVAEYKKQLNRKQKEFRGALHRDEVPKVKVTAKEVYDAIGDKIGVKVRYIQKALKDYKQKNKT